MPIQQGNTTGQSASPWAFLVSPVFVVCLLIVILAIAWQMTWLATDEAIWAYASWLWSAHHGPPYVEAFENKPVGIFLIYRVSQAMFGLTLLPVRLLNAATMLATVWLLYWAAKRYQGNVAGAMAAMIFGLSMTHVITDGSVRAATETFMIFFSTTAFFTLSSIRQEDPLRRRLCLLFGAGAALGAALCFKQIAVFDIAGLTPLCIVASRSPGSPIRSSLRGVLVLFSAIAAVTLLSLVPFLTDGVSLSDYVNRAWAILFYQAPQVPASRRFAGFVESWCTVHFAIVFLFAAYFLCNRTRLRSEGVPFECLLFWFVMAFAGANLHNMFGHQIKQAIAPLALMAALGIGLFLRTTAASWPNLLGFIYAGVVATLFPYAVVIGGVGSWLLPDETTNGRLIERSQHRLATFIDLNTTSDEPIYIWDRWSHAIHLYSQRRSSCRYFNIYLRFAPDFEASLAEDLKRRPPKLVIINEEVEDDAKTHILPPPQQIQAYIDRECRPVEKMDSFIVFQRQNRPIRWGRMGARVWKSSARGLCLAGNYVCSDRTGRQPPLAGRKVESLCFGGLGRPSGIR